MGDELRELHEEMRGCECCPLCGRRRQVVPGEGPEDARVMLVGEAPGAREDEEGRPFIGSSGKFLDKLLEDAGIPRERLYITSAVKCRPPGNRSPHVDELRVCRERWLERQFGLVAPALVVLLGRTAVRQVLGRDDKLADLRGAPIEDAGRRHLVTYHPAAGMRFPDKAAAMRADLARVSAHLFSR